MDQKQGGGRSSDWECFLLPVSVLKELNRLPMHESCRERLEHVVLPEGERTVESIRQELSHRKVCAVSWRWSDTLPAPATLDRLRDWSPMSAHQLRQLLSLVAESESRYLWIDWSCVPQLSGDTMKFINASHDIYSLSPRVVFIPRIKELKRRGWPRLTPQAARAAVDIARAAAEGVFSSGSLTNGFRMILRDPGRTERMEARLRASHGRMGEIRRHVESVLEMLLRLLEGEDVVYPTFDYYSRAWTLAERLAVFKPSREAPIWLGEMHTAGDALLYSMSAFWRNAGRRDSGNPGGARPSLSVADLSAAVYYRGVDPNDEDVRELWDDMNHMVQLAQSILGVASETAALAVICVEWLLGQSLGASDDPGRLTAALLGECASFTAIAIATATLQEEADAEWFRRYLYFQAGSIYGSTVPQDLILAVYRSCGLRERATADEAIESCLLEVFGDSPGPAAGAPVKPSVDRLCREALLYEELHTHLLSTGTGERALAASDFVPMMPPGRRHAAVSVEAWHQWLLQSGLVTCWWFSKLDQTTPTDPSEYEHIDVEQLYCEDVTRLTGKSLEDLFSSTVTVVYKLHRFDDWKWRLVQISLSRQAGRCGEGLSLFRINQELPLEKLLGAGGLLREGRAEADLIAAWNQRWLQSLEQGVHYYWGQCAFSPDVLVVS